MFENDNLTDQNYGEIENIHIALSFNCFVSMSNVDKNLLLIWNMSALLFCYLLRWISESNDRDRWMFQSRNNNKIEDQDREWGMVISVYFQKHCTRAELDLLIRVHSNTMTCLVPIFVYKKIPPQNRLHAPIGHIIIEQWKTANERQF